MISLILLIFAFVLAVLQAVRPWLGTWTAPHLGWLAVALYLLTYILGR